MADQKQAPVLQCSDTVSEPAVSGLIPPAPDNHKPRKRKPHANWRLSVLATPRNARPKYEEFPYVFNSGVSPNALSAPPNERVDHMARPNLRSLYVNKRSFAGNPNTFQDYEQRMDKRINDAWDSIYNEYKKARRDKRLKQQARLAEQRRRSRSAKKSKRKKSATKKVKEKEVKGKEKKGKGKEKGKQQPTVKEEDSISEKSEDFEKQLQEWVNQRSLPKKVFHPEPIKRGPKADLEKIRDRLDTIATPKKPRKKYVELPPPKHIVKEDALKYEATERILELAKLPAFKLTQDEPIVLGAVKPSALQYKVTKRTGELSTPRARASARDADLKEEPFTISKNALKYKATPRIIELAKPLERPEVKTVSNTPSKESKTKKKKN